MDGELEPLNPRPKRRRRRRRNETNEKHRRKRLAVWLSGIAIAGFFLIVIATISIYFAYENAIIQDSDSEEAPFNETFHVLSQTWPIQDQLLPSLAPLDISLDTVSEAMKEAARMERYRQTLEEELVKNNLTTAPGTPSCFHQIVTASKPEAGALIKQGYTMDWIAKVLATKLNLDKKTAAPLLSAIKDVQLAESCSLQTVCESVTSRYRTADGTCNNVDQPELGAAMTPYRRMLNPDYQDGLSAPRNASSERTSLPSARLVSTSVTASGRSPTSSLTGIFMLWGELIAHDISSVAVNKGIACCSLPPSLHHPECFPILIPSDDVFYSKYNIGCMQFSRSAPAPRCSLGVRNQLNQVSSFLDGSTIYGSSQKEQDSVRSFEGGMMRYSLGPKNTELLPLRHPDNGTQQLYDAFVAGDHRVNEHLLLTVMHTVWMREHNRVAAALRATNAHWDDQTLFQESRRIVIAELQHITYNEYLPLLLGAELSSEAGLISDAFDVDDSYDTHIDPSVANVVASSVLRFGHSQIQNSVKFLSTDNRTVQYRATHSILFDPLFIHHFPIFTETVFGQMNMGARAVDTHFSTEVTNHLFEKAGSSYGLDLVAIDIQRGRDHGIPGYNMWRRHCNLTEAKNFKDLRRLGWSKAMVKSVQRIYSSVDDIDLYVGGLGEPPLPEAVVGPTFACILIDQFVRLKRGDRFWYETSMNPQAFTKEQLQELRSVTMARVLCDNVENLPSAQPSVFELADAENLPVPCADTSIPSIDFSHWKMP